MPKAARLAIYIVIRTNGSTSLRANTLSRSAKSGTCWGPATGERAAWRATLLGQRKRRAGTDYFRFHTRWSCGGVLLGNHQGKRDGADGTAAFCRDDSKWHW